MATAPLSAAQHFGSTMLWPVGRYAIDHGLLRVRFQDKRVRHYAPFKCRELPEQFANLKPKDREQELLRFANRYGHLGYNQLIPGSHRRGGEPVDWIWSHVRTVHVCLTLTAYLRSTSTKHLDTYVRAASSDRRFSVGAKVEQTSFDRRSEPDPRQAARWIRRVLINRNLQASGVYHQITDDGISYSVCPTLLAAIYWHLANVVTKGIVLFCEAEGCDRVFRQPHARQRFCTPRCAARQRQREHRRRTRLFL